MRERRMLRNVSWKFNDGGNSLRNSLFEGQVIYEPK